MLIGTVGEPRTDPIDLHACGRYMPPSVFTVLRRYDDSCTLPSSMAEREIPEGYPQRDDIVAGGYKVEGLVGTGGMGIVIRAEQLSLHRKVAVKFIELNLHSDETVDRFMREARAAGQISDPNVVTVHDCGFVTEAVLVGSTRHWLRQSSGTPFLVLELLRGTDLGAWLEARAAQLPIGDSVRFIREACVGIAAVHNRGIVHRDLKPANLFLCTTDSGRSFVKVTDFGIAKTFTSIDGQSAERKITRTGALIGTPQYMAPEQFGDAPTDFRADIWALGVILFELLTGKTPFDGTSLISVMQKVVTEPPPSLSSLRPDVPVPLINVTTKCLQKDPDRRYGRAEELLAALDMAMPTQVPLPPSDAVGAPRAEIPGPSPGPAELQGLVLRFVLGKYQGDQHPVVVGKEIVVGRASDVDMVLVEETMSRRHARFAWQDGRLFVEDLGSINGVFVNGEKIRHQNLKVGDRILIGTSILKLAKA